MTLDQLRMLVKIADTGSVLAAAEALHRTQPTVSVGIRRLENSLGLTLLSRDQYRATLTSHGEAVCRLARLVLQQADTLRHLAATLASGCEAHLRIAIEASCPLTLIMEILRDCEHAFPATDFTLMAENIRGALERLELDEADLIITPWFEENLDVESFRLSETVLTTVAAPNYFPAGSSGELTRDDLRNGVQVIVHDSSRRPRDNSFGVVEGGRRWQVYDHETKKRIILAGMGWGRLQYHLVEAELARGELIELRIADYPHTMPLEIRVARRRQMAHGPVAASLWQSLRRLAGLPSAT